MENYRPIALLQTIYKLIAAMVKNRLVDALETWISKTQYGFRPKRSTAQAIFIARRLMDIAERQGSNMAMVLLDWEKAFDKIAQDKLLQVLRRLRFPKQTYALIANIYTSSLNSQSKQGRIRQKTKYRCQGYGKDARFRHTCLPSLWQRYSMIYIVILTRRSNASQSQV